MKQKLNFNASPEEAEEVLEGDYGNDENEELNEIMRVVLNNCLYITPNGKSSPEITVEQLWRKMEVLREFTTTSPSGRYLGHYK